MEVGAEGAEEAHGVHGPAANLCVRRGGHPIRGSGREPLGGCDGQQEESLGQALAQSSHRRGTLRHWLGLQREPLVCF